MNAKRSTPAAISVVGMIAVLGIAWALDALMAVPLLLLFWHVATRAPRNGWIAAFYVIVGLYFAFFPVIYFLPPIGNWMPQFAYYMTESPAMITFRSGAFIATTGLFSLVLPRR